MQGYHISTVIMTDTPQMQKIFVDRMQDIYGCMRSSDFILIYRGEPVEETVEKALSVAETRLKLIEDVKNLRKKIFSVMVECLQNVIRHADKFIEDGYDKSFIIVLSKSAFFYSVISCNIIRNDKTAALSERIAKLNKLNPEELETLYHNILCDGNFSEKGGAGLGLIDIIRRSGSKIEHSFKKIDEEHSYLIIKSNILT